MSSVFEWLSVGSNIASIMGLFITLKQYNMKAVLENPYLKVFSFSLLFTAFVFLIPWKRIHIESETSVQKPTVIHDTIRVNNDIPHHTIPKEKKLGVVSQKTKTVYIPLSEKNKTNSKIGDTTPKNQTLYSGNNGHIINGNNNNVGVNGDQYNTGITQRTLQDAEKLNIITQIPDKKINILVLADGGKEGYILGQEVISFLKKNGYSGQIRLRAALYGGNTIEEHVRAVSFNGEGTIFIPAAPNVQ